MRTLWEEEVWTPENQRPRIFSVAKGIERVEEVKVWPLAQGRHFFPRTSKNRMVKYSLSAILGCASLQVHACAHREMRRFMHHFNNEPELMFDHGMKTRLIHSFRTCFDKSRRTNFWNGFSDERQLLTLWELRGDVFFTQLRLYYSINVNTSVWWRNISVLIQCLSVFDSPYTWRNPRMCIIINS